MGKKCIKCGYVRDDNIDKNTPETECPQCGVIYAKAEANKQKNTITKNLKECPFCKKFIYKKAKICPYCGENLKRNNPAIIGFITIFLIVFTIFLLKSSHIFSNNKSASVKKHKHATTISLKSKKQEQIKKAKLDSYENNTRFPESIRQEIWLEYLQVERKASKEAEQACPIDPTQNMRPGDILQLTKTTPLMPELNPIHPLAALKKMVRLPAGYFIKIQKVKSKDHTNWYFVRAYTPKKRLLKTGWINSIALMRQSKVNGIQQLKEQAALTNSLNNKYKNALAEQYGITRKQLENIISEGLNKKWINPPAE